MPNLRTDAVNGANTFLVTFDGSDVDLETALAALLALGGGAGATALDGLTDVTITTPTATQILQYNGTAWVNAAAPSGTDLSYTASTRVLASSTGADATLPLVTTGDAGLAPASGGGTSNFLRADGTWTTPAGGGDVTQAGANVFTGTNAFEDIRYVTQTIATPTAIDLASGQYLKHSGNGAVTYNITAGGASAGQVKVVTFELTASGGNLTPTIQYGGNAVEWGADGAPGAITSGSVENFVIHLDGVAAAGAAQGFRRVAGTGSGDVVGPSSATDSHLAQFDGTTGKLLKGGKAAPSGVIIGTTDTQTLTNKTVDAASNTIIPNVAVTTAAVVTLVLGQALTMRPSAGSTSVTLPAAPTAGGWCSVMNKAGASRNVLRAGSNTITLADGTTGQTQAAVANGELALFTCAAGETIWEQQ